MPAQVLKEREKPRLHPELSPSFDKGKFWKRAAFWALALFLVVNAGLFRLESERKSNDLWHGTGSIDLVVNEFRALKEKPTVVLLGSSLVMFPFWSLDKSKDPVGVGDIFHHHGSKELEKQMQAVGIANPHVFSFAVFGQMVSDAYIYVNEFLEKDKAPEYLIYGIAPRDFSDSDLSSPMTTNTFKRLIRIENMAPYADLYLPGLHDKLDFLMGRSCYFYSHRWRLQQEFNKFVEKVYVASGVHEPEKKLDFSKAGFMMFGGLKERWESSEKEYARRYKNIADKDLSVQSGFLKRLIHKARSQGSKVIIVNMPLSDVNRRLLPPGFYSKFRANLALAANQPGVKLVDLGESTDFVHNDYWDTAHLGPSGGEKIVKHILPAIQSLKQDEALKQ